MRMMLARGGVWLAGLCAMAALAQEPRVPYLPTPQDVVERMLQMARVTGSDYLIDLGSGDGRILVTAATRFGARGFGVDINPVRVEEATENARKAGVLDKVAFYQRDLFKTDLSQATVVTLYLLPRVNEELRPRLLALKPGTRIVSHDFSMGDWKPDAAARMRSGEKFDGAGGASDVFLWVIPAKVAGTWRWELPSDGKSGSSHVYTASLAQNYQVVSGSVAVNGRKVPLRDVRLRGDELSFQFTADTGGGPVRHETRGKVEGERIYGSAGVSARRSQGRYDWSAGRVTDGVR